MPILLCKKGNYDITTFRKELHSQTPVRYDFLAALAIGSYKVWCKQQKSLILLSCLIPFLPKYNQESPNGAFKRILQDEAVLPKRALTVAQSIKVEIAGAQLGRAGRIAKFAAQLKKYFTASPSFNNIVDLPKSDHIFRNRNNAVLMNSADKVMIKMLPGYVSWEVNV